jgi:hypothetical protein
MSKPFPPLYTHLSRPPPSIEELLTIRSSVETVGRLSDSLFRFGPFRLGIDGVLSWIPGIGEIYSTGAAAFIIVQGVRARVPFSVLLTCAALMGSRTVVSAVPLAGPAVADLFLAHRMSARLVVKAIDKMLPMEARPAPPQPWYRNILPAARPRRPAAV